jgi:hypothetical protein
MHLYRVTTGNSNGTLWVRPVIGSGQRVVMHGSYHDIHDSRITGRDKGFKFRTLNTG